MGCPSQQQKQERSCSRTIKPVVYSDAKGYEATDQNGSAGRKRLALFGTEALQAKHVECRGRQDEQHEESQERIVHEQDKVRAERAPCDGASDAGQGEQWANKTLACVLDRGDRRSHGGSELVRSEGGVRGQSCNHVGGQGDEPAASGDCVYIACEEHERANDRKTERRHAAKGRHAVKQCFHGSFRFGGRHIAWTVGRGHFVR